MIVWYAIALGILQGIAEFLPISSSGHVLLGAEFLSQNGDDAQMLNVLKAVEFNLAVHLGTFGSIVVVYFKKLWLNRFNGALWSKVALATVPLVFVGLLFKDAVEAKLEDPSVVGYFLLLTATFLALLSLTERRDADGRPTGRDLATMTWLDAIIVGLFQCVAIFPGVSRSGTTIFAGSLSGMQRIAAADFSFFIALPAIAGAAILHTKDVVEQGTIDTPIPILLYGGFTAFFVGIVALKLLLAIVAKGQLWWFAVYCGLLGALAIAVTTH